MDVTIFNEIGKDITAKLQITCGGPLSTKLNEQLIAIKKAQPQNLWVVSGSGRAPS